MIGILLFLLLLILLCWDVFGWYIIPIMIFSIIGLVLADEWDHNRGFKVKLKGQNKLKRRNKGLKFLGFDMNTEIDSFVEKLKEKGFWVVENNYDNSVVMTGELWGMQYTTLTLHPASDRMAVNDIKATKVLEPYDIADALAQIKKHLIKKYGKPIDDDHNDYLRLIENHNVYDSVHIKTDKGSIYLYRTGGFILNVLFTQG